MWPILIAMKLRSEGSYDVDDQIGVVDVRFSLIELHGNLECENTVGKELKAEG